MAHDIVIRGGEIADGSGAEPVRGDLAIDGGVISAVGGVAGSGREEIDAKGQLVTPGFDWLLAKAELGIETLPIDETLRATVDSYIALGLL
jgi:hypothetical protein